MRQESNLLVIDGKPGWKSGTKLTFPGVLLGRSRILQPFTFPLQAGDSLAGQPAQDIIFEIEEKPHSIFTRSKDDLTMTYTLPLVEALCGAEIHINDIDGKPFKVRLDSVHPDSEKSLPNHGMPRKEGGRGSLHIKFRITFPHLNEQQKSQVKAVLPR